MRLTLRLPRLPRDPDMTLAINPPAPPPPVCSTAVTPGWIVWPR